MASSSSIGKGVPCASALSVQVGAGYPMCERRISSFGRPVSCSRGEQRVGEHVEVVGISPSSWTSQPYARNRPAASSLSASSVDPSIVMWLSS